MREQLSNLKIINRVGEIDRHTDNSIVENRNQRAQLVSTAIAATAMGDNIDLYAPMAGCELINWANELINHQPITDVQKLHFQNPYNEQFRCEEFKDIYSAYGVPIGTWGELCYVYVKKKDRKGKLSPRAIRAIWNGVERDYVHSTSAIPIGF